MAIEWTNDLKTGDYVIDSEHKRLLKAANDLVESCSKGRGREEMVRALEFLSFYTKSHFEHEEELMRKHGFPEADFKEHRQWHQGYMQQVEMLSERLLRDGPTISVMADVNTRFGNLVNHIRSLDLKLSKFIG